MTKDYDIEESVMVVEASTGTKLARWFSIYWKYVVLVVTPLICSPVLIVVGNDVRVH